MTGTNSFRDNVNLKQGDTEKNLFITKLNLLNFAPQQPAVQST